MELPTLRALTEVLDSSLAHSKDLEIVLAGLPDLAAKLGSAEIKGLSDRIAAIASLSALTLVETRQYIDHRLRLFGYQGPAPFTPDALTTIARLAEGVPGNINNVCSAAIYLAEQRASNVIDSGIVLGATEQGTRRLMTQGSTPQSSSFISDISDVATADEVDDQEHIEVLVQQLGLVHVARDAIQHQQVCIRLVLAQDRAGPHVLVPHLNRDVVGHQQPLGGVLHEGLAQLGGRVEGAEDLTAGEVVQPWDRSTITAIERAIQKSDLGLNPSSDGTVIRLAIPHLSEERRRELVKQVNRRTEEGRGIRAAHIERRRRSPVARKLAVTVHRMWRDGRRSAGPRTRLEDH